VLTKLVAVAAVIAVVFLRAVALKVVAVVAYVAVVFLCAAVM